MPISGTNLKALTDEISVGIEGIDPNYEAKEDTHEWADFGEGDPIGASPRTFTLIWDHREAGDGDIWCAGKKDRRTHLIIRVSYAGLSRHDADALIENDHADLTDLFENNEGGGFTGMIPAEVVPRVTISEERGGIKDPDDRPRQIDFRVPVRYMTDI